MANNKKYYIYQFNLLYKLVPSDHQTNQRAAQAYLTTYLEENKHLLPTNPQGFTIRLK